MLRGRKQKWWGAENRTRQTKQNQSDRDKTQIQPAGDPREEEFEEQEKTKLSHIRAERSA